MTPPLFLVHCQLDDGLWRRADGASAPGRIRLAGLRNGGHVGCVQAFDPLLRASNLLEHRFEVARDLDREIRRWLPELSAPGHARREAAARQLAAIGRPALPALAAAEPAAPPDARWWFRAVTEEIQRSASPAAAP